jgi:hypothetical protein
LEDETCGADVIADEGMAGGRNEGGGGGRTPFDCRVRDGLRAGDGETGAGLMVELAADDVDELMDWVLDDGGGGRLCLYF